MRVSSCSSNINMVTNRDRARPVALVGSFWRSAEANGCERWRRHQLQTLLEPDPELGHNPAWSAEPREVVQMHLPVTMSRRLQLHLPPRSGLSASLHLSRTTHLQTKH